MPRSEDPLNAELRKPVATSQNVYETVFDFAVRFAACYRIREFTARYTSLTAAKAMSVPYDTGLDNWKAYKDKDILTNKIFKTRVKGVLLPVAVIEYTSRAYDDYIPSEYKAAALTVAMSGVMAFDGYSRFSAVNDGSKAKDLTKNLRAETFQNNIKYQIGARVLKNGLTASAILYAGKKDDSKEDRSVSEVLVTQVKRLGLAFLSTPFELVQNRLASGRRTATEVAMEIGQAVKDGKVSKLFVGGSLRTPNAFASSFMMTEIPVMVKCIYNVAGDLLNINNEIKDSGAAVAKVKTTDRVPNASVSKGVCQKFNELFNLKSSDGSSRC